MASGGEGKQVVGMATIVQCPKCSARLKLPPSFKSGVCPRCHASLSGASRQRCRLCRRNHSTVPRSRLPPNGLFPLYHPALPQRSPLRSWGSLPTSASTSSPPTGPQHWGFAVGCCQFPL